MSPSRRRLLAVLLPALLALPAFAAKKGKRPSAAPAKASYIDWVEVVEVEGRLTAEGRPVGAGYFAGPGTRLELASDGRAAFRLGKEGSFQLRGPATFAVNAGPQPGLDLWRGRILAVLPSLRSPFHVHAQGIVAAVRGTDLYLDLAGRDLYLCVCEGTVEVSDNLPRGYRKTIRAEHHQGVGYHRASGTTLESDHAMEGHTDEEIEGLRGLIAPQK